MSKSAQEIIEAIGVEAAIKLFESFGGIKIYIPKNISNKNYYRDQRIRNDRLSGESPLRLSERYNLHIRKIFSICKNIN